jgi:predicted enzyme related to lactoylglutathione lyase
MAASSAGIGRPVWVDPASPDPTTSHAFYLAVFGWEILVSPDPQHGGYAMGRVAGQDVAGIDPRVQGAGGRVVVRAARRDESTYRSG